MITTDVVDWPLGHSHLWDDEPYQRLLGRAMRQRRQQAAGQSLETLRRQDVTWDRRGSRSEVARTRV